MYERDSNDFKSLKETVKLVFFLRPLLGQFYYYLA